jgi:hypothetical protein
MENLINKNISLQNRGMDELEGWVKMLSDVQKKLIKAYNLRNSELAEQHQKDIDFIQKQIIRLNNR